MSLRAIINVSYVSFCLNSLVINYWALQVFFSHDRALSFVSSCQLKLHTEQTDLNLLIWPMARQPISTPHNFLNNWAAEWWATQETHIIVGFFLGFAQSKELEKYHQLYLTGAGLKTKQREVSLMWEFRGRRLFRGQLEIYWVLEICSGFMVLRLSLVVVRIFWEMFWLMITKKKAWLLLRWLAKISPNTVCVHQPQSSRQNGMPRIHPYWPHSEFIALLNCSVYIKKVFRLHRFSHIKSTFPSTHS